MARVRRRAKEAMGRRRQESRKLLKAAEWEVVRRDRENGDMQGVEVMGTKAKTGKEETKIREMKIQRGQRKRHTTGRCA